MEKGGPTLGHEAKPLKKSQTISSNLSSLSQGFLHSGPNKTFPNHIVEFYLKLRIVGTSLRILVKGVEINIHKDNLGRIFELPFVGKSYTLDGPLGFKNFKNLSILSGLVINHMEKKEVSLKSTH